MGAWIETPPEHDQYGVGRVLAALQVSENIAAKEEELTIETRNLITAFRLQLHLLPETLPGPRKER